jgi:hypothetical protein
MEIRDLLQNSSLKAIFATDPEDAVYGKVLLVKY